MKNTDKKLTPFAIALGATAAISLGNIATANISDLGFTANELDAGYRVETTGYGSDNKMKKGEEGKCGAGKCGADDKMKKDVEGKCGAGKCGADDKMKKDVEGKCGADEKMEKDVEGKCGAGKCGA